MIRFILPRGGRRQIENHSCQVTSQREDGGAGTGLRAARSPAASATGHCGVLSGVRESLRHRSAVRPARAALNSNTVSGEFGQVET